MVGNDWSQDVEPGKKMYVCVYVVIQPFYDGESWAKQVE